VRLQGENGLMRNKFTGMVAQLSQLNGELAYVGNAKQELAHVPPPLPPYKCL